MKDLRLQDQGQKQPEKSQSRLDYEEGMKLLNNNGETAQAANMFHNALVGYEKDKDMNGMANAVDKLGDICASRRELDLALQHYDRVINICHDLGDSISVFSIDKKKAKLFADCGKLEEAINMYLDIMDQYNAMRNPKGTVETLETMADIYLEAGNRDKAADCYRTAAAIHEKFRHSRDAAALMKKAEEIDVAA
jgi:tetratricopeptide (TPR) repeat protein